MRATLPSVDVCVPFAGDDAERSRNWAWLRERWGSHYPICLGESPAGAAAARNEAAAQGSGDVLFFADADILIGKEQVDLAVMLAGETGGYVVAHSRLHYMTEPATRHVLRWDPSRADVTLASQVGPAGRLEYLTWFGAFAVPRVLWEQVGGFDERFGEWGRFALSFWRACRTLAGHHRVHGDACHLWHPSRGPLVTSLAADILNDRYVLADGHPDLMNALVTERRVVSGP